MDASAPPDAGARPRRPATPWLQLLLGALALAWVAAADGRPTVFADTIQYYSVGQKALEAVGLSSPAEAFHDPRGISELTPGAHGAPPLGATVMGARSPSYSLLAYGLGRVSPWASPLLQCALASWVLWLWARLDGRRPRRTHAVLLAVLTAGSTLPYMATFVMPDVWAGLALAALAALAFARDRMGRGEAAAAWALATLGLAAHMSNLGLALATAIAAPAMMLALRAPRRRALGFGAGALGALALGLTLNAALFAGLARMPAGPLHRPPFLTARLLADGPGRTRLRQACAEGAGYALCPLRDYPMRHSDEVLWSFLPGRDIFSTADFALRRRLEREEPRFVLDVVRHDPLGVAGAAARDVGLQLVRTAPWEVPIPVHHYLHGAYWRGASFDRIIWRAEACRSRTDCAFAVPPLVFVLQTEFAPLLAVAAMLAWLLLLARSGRADALRRWEEPEARLAGLIVVMLAATLANAVVCGALSGPINRYEARLCWLWAAAAGLAWTLAPQRDRGGTPHPSRRKKA